MSQLAREFPEEYARIAALPPAQQNAAERELADRLLGRHAMTSPVSSAGGDDGVERATKRCRDCDAEFEVPVEHAQSGSKWYSLCGSCIRNEM